MQPTKNYLSSFLVLFCLALSFSCTKEPVISNVLNSHFKKYIYAYTNGTISARSEVRINFLNAVVGDQELEKEIKSLFDFSPSVKLYKIFDQNNVSPLPESIDI